MAKPEGSSRSHHRNSWHQEVQAVVINAFADGKIATPIIDNGTMNNQEKRLADWKQHVQRAGGYGCLQGWSVWRDKMVLVMALHRNTKTEDLNAEKSCSPRNADKCRKTGNLIGAMFIRNRPLASHPSTCDKRLQWCRKPSSAYKQKKQFLAKKPQTNHRNWKLQLPRHDCIIKKSRGKRL